MRDIARFFLLFLTHYVLTKRDHTRENSQTNHPKRPESWAAIGYVPRLDGIPCEKDAWVPDAVENPVLEANQGKIKGQHRCKVNRR